MNEWKLVLGGGAIALAGMFAGASLFGAVPAQAQQAPYRECMVGRQEVVDIDNAGAFAPYRQDHAVLAPPGWELAGGSGGGDARFGYVMICRR